MANTNLAGYEMKITDKLEMICDHAGPVSYQNVNTNGGAGDVVNASDFQRGGIEEIACDALAASGNFGVIIFVAKMKNGVAVPSVILRWYNFNPATGSFTSEVANGTNLSAESVRLQIRMV
jgi:hypothetical protein